MTELRRRAMLTLEEPALAVPKGVSLVPTHRLWRYPSFANHLAWMIHSATGQESSPLDESEPAPLLFIRRVEWDQVTDGRRFLDPMEGLRQGFKTGPAISARNFVPKGDLCTELGRHLALLSCIQVTLVPRAEIGLDGETSGIEILRGSHLACLSWWCNGPGEWAPLVQWFEGSIRLLETLAAQAEDNSGA
jgi:hypothetical protein